jgi:hypothetical protein
LRTGPLLNLNIAALMRLRSLREPTPWAMGVAQALQTIAHEEVPLQKSVKLEPEQS